MDPLDSHAIQALIDDAAGQLPLRGVVHLWGIGASDVASSDEGLERAQARGCGSLLHLVQALARRTGAAPPRLVVVTRGACAVRPKDGPVATEQSALWGLGRVIIREHPELQCRLIDLEPAGEVDGSLLEAAGDFGGLLLEAAGDFGGLLLEAIQAADREDQVALRGAARLGARLVRADGRRANRAGDTRPDAAGDARPDGAGDVGPTRADGTGSNRSDGAGPNRAGDTRLRSGRLELPDAPSYRLEIATRGVLDHLELRPATREAPGPGAVEVRVRATGLNFRDVLNALDLYPGDPGPLGLECAGEVVAVGADVDRYRPGDRVAALATAAFARYVTVPVPLVVPLPARLTYEDGATIPLAFSTAWHGLHTLAGIKPGDRVLIHAAAGGVGLAAVQIARRAGAEVYATASTPEKHALLRAMGVREVMSSRSLEFADALRAATDGEGVDIVLNALAEEFIPRSLSVLRPGGRFLEIGKRGIWSPERAAALRPDVAYHVYDLGDVARTDPYGLQRMLREVMAAMVEGSLEPLPHTSFGLDGAVRAFRYMAQAKHIGKVVVHHDMAPENKSALHTAISIGADPRSADDRKIGAAQDSTRNAVDTPMRIRGISQDGTWLITGGIGGIGLELAAWLVRRGARHLVLMARSAPSDAARAAIDALEAKGAIIRVTRGDVTRRADVDAMLAEIDASMPPLCAVFHAAGVLDDGVLTGQSWSRMARVLAPKVQGAWHLHEATRARPLEHFVLFSSAASILGSPGQGSYAAANAFLDGLAHHRRSLGLPATSIDWAAWTRVGMAAAAGEQARRKWAAQGIDAVAPGQGMRLLELLLDDNRPQIAVLPVRWSTVAQQFPPDLAPPLLADLALEGARAARTGTPVPSQAAEPTALVRRLIAAPAAERQALMVAHLREQVARVLGLDASFKVDPRQPLRELGLDSLMAVELKNAVGQSLGRNLPATLLFDYPTLEALAGHLVLELAPAATAAPATTAPPGELAPSTVGVEPIAIVGMGCRFPGGADDPERFWALLRDGVDAITEVPPERWAVDDYYDPDPNAPGRMYTRHGGFIHPIDGFDAHFFGIAPREAAAMDPQQRLLLETAWEALERAGVPPDTLAGSQTGVFIGISGSAYQQLLLKQGDLTRIDAYFGTGSASSVAAGRISYVLGLQGPCVSIDTACSSSLVAVHQACQSLRAGECRLALAGGVNLPLSAEGGIYLSKLRALSPDGRCKTFDEGADGYVRAEGCGIVVLKRLADALEDGDPIRAVIRGSAVNQDGRSGGLTAPNGPAQEAVLRRALEAAGIAPRDVGFVETHGTGTALGDPIEVQALSRVLGVDRPAGNRVVLSAVKTNIGHLEAAAGIAGLIKAVLVLEHGEIPPVLHLKKLNPHLDWTKLPVQVAERRIPWGSSHRPRVAGVSAFGFSGTNAHVLVEEAPPTARRGAAVRGAGGENGVGAHAAGAGVAVNGAGALPHAAGAGVAAVGDSVSGVEPPLLLPLSARSSGALKDLARAYHALCQRHSSLAWWVAACDTAGARRAHHEHRLAVCFDRLEDLDQALTAFLEGRTAPGLQSGHQVAGLRRGLVFVFPDTGGGWTDAARQLQARSPAFRDTLDRCAAALSPLVSWSLHEVLTPRGADSGQDRLEVAYPAQLAFQLALAAHWGALGVRPDAVLGHRAGELAAACVAGSLSLEEAVRAACLRGREPDTDAWRAGIEPRPGALPLYSTATGRLEADRFDPDGWARSLEKPVLYSAAVRPLVQAGQDLLLEIGSRPALTPALADALREAGSGGSVVSVRSPGDAGHGVIDALAGLYAAGYTPDWSKRCRRSRYVDLPTYPWQRSRYWIDGPAGTADRAGPGAADISDGANRRGEGPRGTNTGARRHPLLGEHLPLAWPPGTHLWQGQPSSAAMKYLEDHRVQSVPVMPAAGYLELALAAGRQVLGNGVRLEAVGFQRVLPMASDSAPLLQVMLTPAGDEAAAAPPATGTHIFKVFSASSDPHAGWTLHASGRVIPVGDMSDAQSPEASDLSAGLETPDRIRARCPQVVSRADHYRGAVARGLEYGPAFQAVARIWRRDGEALARLELPQPVADPGEHILHPVLLDACFQVLGAAVPSTGASGLEHELYLPVGLETLDHQYPIGSDLWVHARLEPASTSPDTLSGDLTLIDGTGRRLLELRGFQTQRLGLDAQRSLGRDPLAAWMHEVRWRPAALDGAHEHRTTGSTAVEPGTGADVSGAAARLGELPPGGRWLLFADDGGVGDQLRTRLEALGQRCVSIYARRALEPEAAEHGQTDLEAAVSGRAPIAPGVDPGQDSMAAKNPEDGRHRIDPGNPEDLRRVLESASGADPAGWRGILHLWSLDAGELRVAAPQTIPTMPPGSATHPSESATHPSESAARPSESAGMPLPSQDAVEIGLGMQDPTHCRAIAREAEWSGTSGNDGQNAPPLTGEGPGERSLPRDAWSSFSTASQGRGQGRGLDGQETALVGDAISSTLYLLQNLPPETWRQPPRLWLVTRNAQAVDPADGPVAVTQAPLWGMGATIAHEYPALQCTLLDLGQGDALEVDALLAEVRRNGAEPRVALRGGSRYVARLERRDPPAGVPPALRADATYLITGGLGGLGLEVARWMVSRGARNLVLVARSAPNPATQRVIDALERADARVVPLRADVSRADQLATILEEVRGTMPPLRGIIHAAAVLDDGILARLTPERVATVFAPKARGAWLLHRLTLEQPLDFFVMFSSVASIVGSPGQANYAAANAFLDALVHHRHQRGLPALSINWGPWAEVGMAVSPASGTPANGGSPTATFRGMAGIPTALGLEALERLLPSAFAQVGVMRLDFGRWLELLPHMAASPFFAAIAGDAPASPRPSEARLRKTLLETPPAGRAALLEAYLREQVARSLGMAPGDLELEAPLNRQGIDSLMALDLRSRIEADVGVPVPVVRFLQGLSAAQLAADVLQQLDDRPSSEPSPGGTDDLEEGRL